MGSERRESEELATYRQMAQRFIENEIAPQYEAWEEAGIFPRELWRTMGQNGFLCADLPEKYGAAGASFRLSSVFTEELSRMGYASVAVSVTVHADIVAHYIHNAGTESQKEQYLPGMVSGDIVGAIAMSEPAIGSDLQGMQMRAVSDGDSWVLNGTKTFITNGQHADVIVTAARTNPDVAGAKGTTLFLVDGDTAGYQRGSNFHKIGLHASDTSELIYEDVRVGSDRVLGRLDAGFGVLMGELPRERLALASDALAACGGMLDLTIQYVKERKAFGTTLANFQNTKFKLAALYAKYRVARSFMDACFVAQDDGTLDTTMASVAKLQFTELQGEIADECLQLFGGYGYMREYPIARAFVDARIQRIYGGTSEIMKEIISRAILKES